MFVKNPPTSWYDEDHLLMHGFLIKDITGNFLTFVIKYKKSKSLLKKWAVCFSPIIKTHVCLFCICSMDWKFKISIGAIRCVFSLLSSYKFIPWPHCIDCYDGQLGWIRKMQAFSQWKNTMLFLVVFPACDTNAW